MSKQKKSKQIKYFTMGDDKKNVDDKDVLSLLFPTIEALESFHKALGTLLYEPFPEKPNGLYFSSTGTFKDHHP